MNRNSILTLGKDLHVSHLTCTINAITLIDISIRRPGSRHKLSDMALGSLPRRHCRKGVRDRVNVRASRRRTEQTFSGSVDESSDRQPSIPTLIRVRLVPGSAPNPGPGQGQLGDSTVIEEGWMEEVRLRCRTTTVSPALPPQTRPDGDLHHVATFGTEASDAGSVRMSSFSSKYREPPISVRFDRGSPADFDPRPNQPSASLVVENGTKLGSFFDAERGRMLVLFQSRRRGPRQGPSVAHPTPAVGHSLLPTPSASSKR